MYLLLATHMGLVLFGDKSKGPAGIEAGRERDRPRSAARGGARGHMHECNAPDVNVELTLLVRVAADLDVFLKV